MRLSRIVAVLAAPLLLTGCLLTPGKFASELALMKDGTFSYSYAGEIQMLALSKLAAMGSKASDEFEPQPCYGAADEIRECTDSELAEQRAQWDAEADERAARKADEAEQFKTMFGGVDPSDPEAAEELAEHLQRQKGWRKVEHKGDGLFQVDFAISGSLSHDFAFPTVEGLPIGSAFVNVILRKDDKVRIEAPGFSARGAGNPLQAMMGGMMGLANLDAPEGEDQPVPIVPTEGTFTIVTNGEILANNTDEGAVARGDQRVLVWQINPRTEQMPTALIALD